MDNHYEALGLEPDATPEEIKAAYRKKAQKAHPDRIGGDVVVFQKLQKAYDTLSDEEKRRKYDAGEADPNDPHAQMLERLTQLFLGCIEHVPDADSHDIPALMREQVSGVQKQLKASIATTTAAIRKREKVLKRLKGPKDSFLHKVCQHDIEKHKASIRQLETALAETVTLLTALKEYSYQVEEKEPRAGSSVFDPYRALRHFQRE